MGIDLDGWRRGAAATASLAIAAGLAGAQATTILNSKFECGTLSPWIETDLAGTPADTLWHVENFCKPPPAGSGGYAIVPETEPYLSIRDLPGTVILWETGTPPASPCSSGTCAGAGSVVADDESSAPIAMPFPFEFFGVPVGAFEVNENGFVAFDPAAPTGCGTSSSNPLLGTPGPPETFAAPWWDDLLCGATDASVSWRVDGSPGAQSLTVAWENQTRRTPACAETAQISFLLRLHEGTNAIEFVYDPATFVGAPLAAWNASVGLEGANASVDVGGAMTGIPSPATSTIPCSSVLLAPRASQVIVGYTVTQTPPAFASIVGAPGAVTHLTHGGPPFCPDDVHTGFVPIGFPFPFFEEIKAAANLNANGLLRFDSGTSLSGASANQPPGTPPGPAFPPIDDLVMPWWDDLRLSQDGVTGPLSQVVSLAGPTSFTVEWSALQTWSGSGCLDDGSNLSFQAVLHDDGRIEFRYDHAGFAGGPVAISASVGVENSTGSIGVDATGLGAINTAFPADGAASPVDLLLVPVLGPVPPSIGLPASFEKGAAAFHQGDAGTYTYAPGAQGAIESPLVAPSAGADRLVFAFDHVSDREHPTAFDQAFVEVRAAGAPAWTPLLQITAEPPCASPGAVVVTDDPALQCILPGGGQVRFVFTADDFGSDYLGWVVDNVRVLEEPLAGIDRIGAGCAGSGGFVPSIATVGGTPSIGNAAFGIGICRGAGGAIAFPFAGLGPDPAGTPVAAGCAIHLDLLLPILQIPPALALAGTGPGEGSATRMLPIPSLPALVGATLAFQWVVLDGGAPLGLTLSDGVAATFQP